MTYYAFYQNGVSVSNPNISDLSQYPDIEYFVKEEYSVHGYAKYTTVDAKGLPVPLKIGGFELRDVGYVSYVSATKQYPFTITICETRLNNVFPVTLYGTNAVSIYPGLVVPFLNLLNEHGSYLSYKQSLEVERLHNKVNSLTKQLEECRSRI
ncbi:MAG: hypothetical protein EOO85_16305 [Pedobacter sp.]|nr:MAG: hypothetical protein EOO85_16305 [Pedobacter sp.]